MPKTQTAANKLVPTVVSKSKVASVAAQDGRKRPIVAINEEGKLVVCCRRTAKKNGWCIQDVLYGRTKPQTVEAHVVAEAPKVKKTKKVADAIVDEILGG